MCRVVEVDFITGRAGCSLVGLVIRTVADEVGADSGGEGVVGSDPADAVVVPVEDVGRIGIGEGQIDGPIESGGEQGSPVAVETGFAGACLGADGAWSVGAEGLWRGIFGAGA